jgi:hypothetical protein
MSALLCPVCEKWGLTWEDVDQEDLLENGIMTCDNPECKAQFVGIPGWKAELDKRRPWR